MDMTNLEPQENLRKVPYKIMIVDDEPANLRLLERLFRRQYQVVTAASGKEALALLEQHDFALLLTDQRMPGMTGIELLKHIDGFRPQMVRIILTGYTDMSALVEAINCGQVYKYVTKPWSNDSLRQTIARAVEHYELIKSRYDLEVANKRLVARLEAMTRGMVRAIADALEAKDQHVYGHARRVSGYAMAIGRRLRLDVKEIEQIALAALLHDIGKIGTPDSLLLKPSTFTDEERNLIKLHSERGARILAGVPEMEDIVAAVRHHHENFDGTGYPEGLQGEQIPLASRIIFVADAYDAITSPRPFRQAFTHETAIELLHNGAGKTFDPEVVRAFCGLEALAKVRSSIDSGILCHRVSSDTSPHELHRRSFADLVREVKQEPALAANVLREANAEADESTGTANLQNACEQLGEARVRGLIAQNCASEFCAPLPEQIWRHSLRCAVAAQLLAEQTGIIDAQEAYTLGLLHDIGDLLLRTLFPEEMENILWFADDARIDREVTAFGVDHAQVGQWMLQACHFPRELTSAVQTHHDAMRINAPIALLLHVANGLASAKDHTEFPALDAFGSDRLAMLGLTRSDLVRLHDSTRKILQITSPHLPPAKVLTGRETVHTPG